MGSTGSVWQTARHPITGDRPDYVFQAPNGKEYPRWRNPLKRGEDVRQWYYTLAEISARLGVSTCTIRSWIKQERLKAIRPGYKFLVKGQWLEDFLKASPKPYG